MDSDESFHLVLILKAVAEQTPLEILRGTPEQARENRAGNIGADHHHPERAQHATWY